MANVFDVAQYIRDKTGQISTIKLQKLVFYSKAWSLVLNFPLCTTQLTS